MSRIAVVLAAALALTGAAGASGAAGPVFTLVPDAPAALPSAEIPNADGTVVLPPAFASPPAVPRTLSYPQLNALWHRAGAAYGIPWQVLAAINKIESNFGRNMGPSSAGALGWMQFMPSTWLRWGMDATGDGVANPWEPEDAIFSAARYLAAAGAREDLYRGIFAYNHADWYVRDVLELAAVYGNGGGALTFTLDRLQVRLDDARGQVTRANRTLAEAVRKARAARRVERGLARRAAAARLVSDRLALERRVFHAGVRADEATGLVEETREALATAESALDAAQAGAGPASLTPGAGLLLGTPMFASGYAFPVGGGPSVVSVGSDHHDYPAADIAAPEGAPLYALIDGVVRDAWSLSNGRCGIGFVLLGADGREWTYCHLSYLEPVVAAGAQLTTGAPVGLVGSTGNSSGPHLHLQTGPELTYPQREPWFQALAGTAFSWQHETETQPVPVAPFSPGAVFAVIERPVFELVSHKNESPDGVIEFSLST